MHGWRERFDAMPLLWTEQYYFGLAYVGHAESWDQARIYAQLDAETRNSTITYRRRRKELAVTIARRDLQGTRAEVEFGTMVSATPEP